MERIQTQEGLGEVGIEKGSGDKGASEEWVGTSQSQQMYKALST